MFNIKKFKIGLILFFIFIGMSNAIDSISNNAPTGALPSQQNTAPQACMISSTPGTGSLDVILTKFATTSMGWLTTTEKWAKIIFGILFGLEFMWQLSVRKVFAGDVEKIWVFVFTRLCLGFFFGKYLVNIELYTGIISLFMKIGTEAGGINIDPSSGVVKFGPSEILNYMNCVTYAMDKSSSNLGISHIGMSMFMGIAEAVMMIALSVIAFIVMKALLQSYFMQYGGFVMTGFAGSSWTQSFWNGYLKGIISVSVKLLACCLIMSLLMGVIQAWGNQIIADYNHFGNDTATLIVALSSDLMLALGTSIIMAMIAYQLPEWAASILSGEINANFGQVIAGVAAFGTGAAGAAKLAGAVSNAGIGGAKAVLAGSKSLAKSAMNRSAPPIGGLGASDASAQGKGLSGAIKTAGQNAKAAGGDRLSKAKRNIAGGTASNGKREDGFAQLIGAAHSNMSRNVGSNSSIRSGGVDVNLHRE